MESLSLQRVVYRQAIPTGLPARFCTTQLDTFMLSLELHSPLRSRPLGRSLARAVSNPR